MAVTQNLLQPPLVFTAQWIKLGGGVAHYFTRRYFPISKLIRILLI